MQGLVDRADTGEAASEERPRTRRARGALVLGVLVASMAAVFGVSFTYPTMFPEHAWAWSINHDASLRDLLAHYGEFGGAWYKPTELYTYFWVLERLVDWQNLYAHRVVTLSLLLAAAALVALVVHKRFPEDRFAPLIAAVIFAAHPTHYVVVFENLGNVLLYVLFVVAALLCYVSLSGPRPWGRVAAGLALYLLALTCREQSMALSGLVVATLVLDRLAARLTRTPVEPGLERARLVFVLAVIAITAVYWRVHVTQLTARTGGYRTGFDAAAVTRNLTVLPEWLLYYYGSPKTSYLLNPIINPVNTAFSLAVCALLVLGWGWMVRRRGVKALAELAFGLLWVLGFLAIPVFAGGEPWHLLLPAGGVALLLALPLARAAASVRQPWLAGALAGVTVLVFTAYGAVNFEKMFNGSRPGLYKINTEAVLQPPVPREKMPKGAVVYYRLWHSHEWNFGAAHLFDFVYRDPTLKTAGIDEDTLTPEQAKQWLAAPHAYFFSFTNGIWLEETGGLRPYVLRTLDRHLAQTRKAGDLDALEATLKPIVTRHPELQRTQAQLDCVPRLRAGAAPECEALFVAP